MKASPSLKRRVRKRVLWALDGLSFLVKGRDIPFQIRYFSDDTAAGYCERVKGILWFNEILLAESPEKFIREVVPHETIHLVHLQHMRTRDKASHGKEFRRLCKILGVPYFCLHSFDTDRCPMPDPDVFVYKCMCQHQSWHEITERMHISRQKKPKKCELCRHVLEFSHIRKLRKHK